MQSTWIVVADAGRARILEFRDSERLAEIKNFVNPAERNENAELRTDSHGRFYGADSQAHTAEPAVLPKEHEAEQFAITLAKYLNYARNQNRYSKLQLIAAPEFLGLMRNKLHRNVMNLVENELSKDLSTATIAQIEQYVKH